MVIIINNDPFLVKLKVITIIIIIINNDPFLVKLRIITIIINIIIIIVMTIIITIMMENLPTHLIRMAPTMLGLKDETEPPTTTNEFLGNFFTIYCWVTWRLVISCHPHEQSS